METLENGLQPYSGASLQSCRNVDADAWCKYNLVIRARIDVHLNSSGALVTTNQVYYVAGDL